ncbi:MAG: hypothetical protein DRN90_00650 [Thermoproteota archaeon]|nr:MAG: hypothetical protein DRG83_01270 [Deltaproteobacteria bacterium]RLG49894.1 MAG: hypothetical protein DRN90_00650 [Candidatus Korarchaeota archaeon]
MGELKYERCARCGAPLWPVKRRVIRRELGEYQGMVTINLWWDITCRWCGHVNRIWWLADPIGQPRRRKDRPFLAAVPAV